MSVERRAARVLLVAMRSVLLIKGRDPGRPDDGWWWMTPGGGVEDGESIEAAAVREVREETGLTVHDADLGPMVATRVATFEFEHRRFRQAESFFAVEVARFEPAAHGWDDLERRSLLDHRWWSVDELRSTSETFFPVELPDLVEAVVEARVTQPIHLSGS